MNITDFIPQNVSWPEILELQKQLALRFEPELKERFDSFDIDSPEDQDLFKVFCWRLTEELVETIEAYVKDPYGEGLAHMQEEAIDALNFFIELCILSGCKFNPEVLIGDTQGTEALPAICSEIVYHVGRSANKMKNRPWRQTQYLVNIIPFEQELVNANAIFGDLLATVGLTTDQAIRDMWSRKYRVNVFRLDSNY